MMYLKSEMASQRGKSLFCLAGWFLKVYNNKTYHKVLSHWSDI